MTTNSLAAKGLDLARRKQAGTDLNHALRRWLDYIGLAYYDTPEAAVVGLLEWVADDAHLWQNEVTDQQPSDKEP